MARPLPEYLAYLVRSIGHKFRTEANADLVWHEHGAAICYATPLDHPWPRTFSYRTEFFTGTADPEVLIPDLQGRPAEFGADHVLYLLSGEITYALIVRFESRGWQHAWTNLLLERRLDVPQSPPPDTRVMVKPLEAATLTEIAPLFAFDETEKARALADERILDLAAFFDGEVAGLGQVILLEPGWAYVADLFTRPTFRRRGVGRTLMWHLEAAARAAGARRILLIPSRMTRESGFYAHLGYRPVLEIGVFIPG